MKLLKLAVLLLCFSFSGNDLAAQKGKLTFGPKLGTMVGFPLPTGEIPDSSKGSPLMGPNVGVFFMYQFSPKWSIWIEGNFNRKAAEFSSKLIDFEYQDEETITTPNGTVITATIETVFNGETWGKFDNYYFETPIMARYSFNKKWHLMAGMYYASLAVSNSEAYIRGNVGASQEITEEERDLAKEMNLHDYGSLLGFQYQYKPLLVDFRMSYGFTSIVKEDYTAIESPLHNLFAQLSVNFQILRLHAEEPKP
ncbi:PorT family protein [bacterium SCSIO 12741]|nr:PorT family protein [bacterium SCSIO 12741]